MRATVTPAPSSAADARRARRAWRARHAGRWLAVALAAAGALPGLAFLALHAARASDGAHLRPGAEAVVATGVVVSPLGRAVTPLREGDVVVAVDGVPLAALAARLVGGEADPVAAERLAGLRRGWRIGATVPYAIERDGEALVLDVRLGRHPLGAAVARTWGTVVFALVQALVAALVFARRPDLPATRVLFAGAGALIGATTWSLGLQVADLVDGVGFWLYQVTTVLAFGAFWASVAHFAAVFPAPLPLARRPGFAAVLYGGSLAALAGYLVLGVLPRPDPLARLAGIGPFTGAHAAAFLALALVAVVVQFRRAPAGAARAQIRWVVLAALVAGAAGLGLYLVPPLLGAAAVSPNVIGAIVTVFPLGIAIAVLAHRLFDIDRLLHRALVYGALTLGVVAAYVAAVALLGTLLRARGGWGPGLVATGLVAVLVLPLRARLQRAVDRLMYGERDDPAAVLARLGARLEDALAPEAVLPTLAATVAETLRLPYVGIELAGDVRSRPAAAHGRPQERVERWPLTYRGARLGDLVVAPRAADEPFVAAERALLATIARQAGVAAAAVRSTEDLRRSRERLVAAREEERRRLRRDLHDGVGPALASLTLKLDAAANVLERDPAAARALLAELRSQVQGAIDDLRGVVHALRPPALDDLGLRASLREQARRSEHGTLRVAFDAPEALPPMAAATEVAAFRIVQEALANVVKHARAARCWVRVEVGDGLVLVVEDDGVGPGQARVRALTAPAASGATPVGGGVGWTSMRERAAELGGRLEVGPRPGGGTRVTARLPLDPPEGAA